MDFTGKQRPQWPPDWHRNIYGLTHFDPNELYDIGALGFEASAGDLDNALHPLFQEPIFNNQAKKPWIMPALRLATKFLTEPTLLAYFHSLTCTRWKPLDEASKRLGHPLSQFVLEGRGPHKTLDAVQLRDVRFMIDEVAKTTRIRFTKLPGNTYGIARERGIDEFPNYKLPQLDGLTLAGLLPSGERMFPRGGQRFPLPFSVIEMNVWTQRVQQPKFDAFATTPDARSELKVARLTANLILAVTLIHEFAHVCCRFRRGADPHLDLPREAEEFEPFFENHRLAEAGFALQSYLMGGIFGYWSQSVQSPEDPVQNRAAGCYWRQWPDVGRTSVMEVNGKYVANPVLRTIEFEFSTEYALPIPWVQQLFTKTFWDDYVSRYGVKALEVPTLLGLREHYRPYDALRQGRSPTNSSWLRHADKLPLGIVRPGQPPLPGYDVGRE